MAILKSFENFFWTETWINVVFQCKMCRLSQQKFGTFEGNNNNNDNKILKYF